jgi:selenocysteine lyase/cysteine desulfurase
MRADSSAWRHRSTSSPAIGIDRIAARLLDLKAHLCEGLDRLGLRIVGPREGSAASGITPAPTRSGRGGSVSFTSCSTIRVSSPASATTARVGPISVSVPHFYNTNDEVERVLEVIAGAGT